MLDRLVPFGRYSTTRSRARIHSQGSLEEFRTASRDSHTTRGIIFVQLRNHKSRGDRCRKRRPPRETIPGDREYFGLFRLFRLAGCSPCLFVAGNIEKPERIKAKRARAAQRLKSALTQAQSGRSRGTQAEAQQEGENWEVESGRTSSSGNRRDAREFAYVTRDQTACYW